MRLLRLFLHHSFRILLGSFSLSKVQLTVDLIRRKNPKWFWGAISAVVSIVCAIIILDSPFTTTAVLWMFTAISLIVEAVFDFITVIMSGKEKVA